ncbi:MAG TPA: hypothetical protein VKA48_10430 [Gammaproteobacteria bacterium]|nr:hypothetical protein [Gammaproteobacteria bacterium]
MNVLPIPFVFRSAAAIHDGRKIQTRRPVKPQPPKGSALHRHYGDDAPRPELAHTFGWFVPEAGDLWPCNDEDRIACPFGQPGDLLWVQEPWRIDDFDDVAYETGDGWIRYPEPEWQDPKTMPRWASRLTLVVEEVRVERVQDISEVGAKAEGVDSWMAGGQQGAMCTPVENFSICLDSIYLGKGLGWDANPWVWTILFRPIFANVDQVLKDPAAYGVEAAA